MAASARISRDVAVIGVRSLDDGHLTWVAAEAYAAYRAAVAREETAARDLQRLCELTQPYQDRLARSQ
jgi:hypothetical protein